MDSDYMQSFKTLAHELLVLARAKDWPASLQLTLSDKVPPDSGDLT